MPGNATIAEAPGQVQINTQADFAMAIIGCASMSPVAAGLCAGPYNSPAQATTDLGLGDGVDALMQAISATPGNPAPTPALFYRLPPTTPGARGTLTTSGVTGTSVVTATASTHPLGTYQPVAKVPAGGGGTVGTGPIQLMFSLDGGRTFLPPVTLTTQTTVKVQLLINGAMTDTGVQYSLAAGTLLAGDTWSESATTPPMFADSDLFAAGPPATGAFAAIAQSSQQVGRIVLTEPVATSDISTLIGGLNYALNTYGKRWRLTVRFRDPTSSESDATYVAAFQAFLAAATLDPRIEVLCGSGLLTDAFRAFQYYRSFLPAYLARLQSTVAIRGQKSERLAQNPGWVARGPLEGFSLRDTNGNPIGHDEFVYGGIDAAPGAATGGGVCCCYRHNVQVQGTYVSNRSTVMYPALSTVLTPMDRSVANALEQVAVGISLTSIGGADVWDPTTLALDPDILNGIATKIAKAIRDNYADEFQNANDPNLVVINPTVQVNGAQVTITGTLNVRFYGYTDTIALTFSATR